MSETNQEDISDLVDYEEEENVNLTENAEAKSQDKVKELKKGSYVGINSSGFRDFLLKSELLLAVTDCAFEHPSEGTQAFT